MPTHGLDPESSAEQLLKWYAKTARDLPWRHTKDPYSIWVSEIMLQQTQVTTVIPYWNRWMATFPDVQALARADEDEVLAHWAGLGYYRRARQLKKAAEYLVQERSGILPESVEEWMTLPGVGRYTAGAVTSIAYNLPSPLVDGNVQRVFLRLLADPTPPTDKSCSRNLWNLACDWVEAASRMPQPRGRQCGDLNQALMELGATVCTPRGPECPACPLQETCLAHQKGKPEDYPTMTPRPSPTPLDLDVWVVKHRGRYLVRKRSEDRHNAGLWEFPEWPAGKSPTSFLEQLMRASDMATSSPWRIIRHSITRYKLSLRSHRIHLVGSRPALADSRWVRLSEMAETPLAGAHAKIHKALLQEDGAP